MVVLGDTQIARNFGCDHGIAAQTILLAATEQNLAGCMIGLIARDKLRTALEIAPQYEILLVIALGKRREQAVIDQVSESGDIKYWRDEADVHHVPKRPLDDLILR
jgi:nitroreductase